MEPGIVDCGFEVPMSEHRDHECRQKDPDGDRDRPERATCQVADERRENDQGRRDDAREGKAV